MGRVMGSDRVRVAREADRAGGLSDEGSPWGHDAGGGGTGTGPVRHPLRRKGAGRNRGPRALRTALVGYGYWGPNLARNIAERGELELSVLCELDRARAAVFGQCHPGVPVLGDLDQVLADPGIDAVVVATPPHTHHPIVRRALLADKHVLVEKPLATCPEDARELVDLARERSIVLMPGHTFVYSPAVTAVGEFIRGGALGEVYFCTSQRMNLGKYQAHGVIWDLAPHDFSILLHWLGRPVVQVSATARSVFQTDIPETAFVSLTFEGGAVANIQVSWLAPRKMRQMVIAGSQRMVQYDDTASDEPVRLFDRGMDFRPPANFGEYQLTYRTGDVVSPKISPSEPLSLELADFANAITSGEEPLSNAALGLEIVRVLHAAGESLRRQGEPVSLEPSPGFLADVVPPGRLSPAA
jgi:predicted dehydrogenase